MFTSFEYELKDYEEFSSQLQDLSDQLNIWWNCLVFQLLFKTENGKLNNQLVN